MKAFGRIALDPGESRALSLAIDGADLALVAADGRWRMEPGMFDLWVTAGEGTQLHASFEVF